ncbi:hypothetical protein K438DRAFT_1776753 [Mycena galopus ATCC 62051]|nr:hypothetical protein K438DRAFT_1776753 [Mycena galopus ATCC 62051]
MHLYAQKQSLRPTASRIHGVVSLWLSTWRPQKTFGFHQVNHELYGSGAVATLQVRGHRPLFWNNQAGIGVAGQRVNLHNEELDNEAGFESIGPTEFHVRRRRQRTRGPCGSREVEKPQGSEPEQLRKGYIDEAGPESQKRTCERQLCFARSVAGCEKKIQDSDSGNMVLHPPAEKNRLLPLDFTQSCKKEAHQSELWQG